MNNNQSSKLYTITSVDPYTKMIGYRVLEAPSGASMSEVRRLARLRYAPHVSAIAEGKFDILEGEVFPLD